MITSLKQINTKILKKLKPIKKKNNENINRFDPNKNDENENKNKYSLILPQNFIIIKYL